MKEHSLLMAEKLPPSQQSAGEALALIREATELILEAAREAQSGAPGWRVAVCLRLAEKALEAASERCSEAALEVWPLPVAMRDER
jgi:hypothetical protein